MIYTDGEWICYTEGELVHCPSRHIYPAHTRRAQPRPGSPDRRQSPRPGVRPIVDRRGQAIVCGAVYFRVGPATEVRVRLHRTETPLPIGALSLVRRCDECRAMIEVQLLPAQGALLATGTADR